MIVLNIDEHIRQCKKVGFIPDLCPDDDPKVVSVFDVAHFDLTFEGYTYSDILMLHFSDAFHGFTDETWDRIVEQKPDHTLISHDEMLANRMKNGNLTPERALSWSGLLEYWFIQNLGSEQEELPKILIDVLRDTDLRDHPGLCAFLGGYLSTVGDYSPEYYRYCEMLSDTNRSPFLEYYLTEHQLSIIEQLLLDADAESPTFVDYRMNPNLVPWNTNIVLNSENMGSKLEDKAYHLFLSNKTPVTIEEKKVFDDAVYVMYSSQYQKPKLLSYTERVTDKTLRYLILGKGDHSVENLTNAVNRWGTHEFRMMIFDQMKTTLNLERTEYVSPEGHLDDIDTILTIFHLLPPSIQAQYNGGINLANIATINSPGRSVFHMAQTSITRLAVLSKMTNWDVPGGGSLFGDYVYDFVKEIPEIFGRFLDNTQLGDEETTLFTFDQLNEMIKHTTNADILAEWKRRL